MNNNRLKVLMLSLSYQFHGHWEESQLHGTFLDHQAHEQVLAVALHRQHTSEEMQADLYRNTDEL